MKKYSLLLLVSVCFIFTSCDETEKIPPHINGVWTALVIATYIEYNDGTSTLVSVENYWEGERVLTLGTDNTWTEQIGETIHTGYWELRYENRQWVLYLQQTVSHRKFFVIEASFSTLILNEITPLGTIRQHSETTYAKIGRN